MKLLGISSGKIASVAFLLVTLFLALFLSQVDFLKTSNVAEVPVFHEGMDEKKNAKEGHEVMKKAKEGHEGMKKAKEGHEGMKKAKEGHEGMKKAKEGMEEEEGMEEGLGEEESMEEGMEEDEKDKVEGFEVGSQNLPFSSLAEAFGEYMHTKTK
jgi:hypothetical protein